MSKNRISLSNSILKIDLKPEFSSINNEAIIEFEREMENYFKNNKKVVALNSGTSAIHLALILGGVQKGDEVICQSFTFVATVNPVIYQKAKPVFVDSERDTWNMCPKLLEEAIKNRIKKGKKPKAIIVVHLYGMPAKMDEILTIAKKYNIILIEDAAEALGSEYKGQKCGTFGDFGIVSFNNNKIVTTFGGGALICKNQKDKEKAVFLATQARDEYDYYQHSQLGYNYRMSSFLAAIGIQQFKNLKEDILLKREKNSFYNELFKIFKFVTVFKEPSIDYYSNHWLNCILVGSNKNNLSAEKIKILLDASNIETRLLWKPMHLQPYYEKYDCFGGKVSENLFKSGLCLPSGSSLTDDDLKRIAKSINKIL